jgi:hypothetical protein
MSRSSNLGRLTRYRRFEASSTGESAGNLTSSSWRAIKALISLSSRDAGSSSALQRNLSSVELQG